MNKSSRSEKYSFLKTLIALVLLAGCLWASQWQFHRGLDRQERNSRIESHVAMPIKPLESVRLNPASHEWQTVSTEGEFDTKNQILLRNRYSEGVYGFELLTLFTTINGKIFWVDCGWVKAGKDALTRPQLPTIPTERVKITGRVRLDSSLPRGSFFAIPTNSNSGLISKANAQGADSTEDFYLDLLSGSQSVLTPVVPAALPELADGPHLAYALQWVFFGGLVVYGRFLIRRDVLSSKEL
ncbi:MAG: SURF1 family protein [Actinobacteria bacterium]|nr:SURF1 family protein [Actinomycetota bacterium]